jgi:SAM-dependent methyltransferase
MRWTRLMRGRRLPAAAKDLIWRAAAVVDGPNRLLYRVRAGDRRPVPPLSIRGHVGAFFRPSAYVESGRVVLDDLERVLRDAGRALSSAHDVLDLACGPGRVSMHLLERYPNAQVTGCDVDPRSIDWAARHLERGAFVATSAQPPLPFDDSSFDLVFSYSLWTHLSEPAQLAWLAEVRRLLRPDGIAVLTTHGVGIHAWMTGSRDAFVQSDSFMERLRAAGSPREHGFIFVPYQESALSGPGLRGIEGEYGMSFQTPAYTRERWSQQVEILDVVPDAVAHQDAVLLRRRDHAGERR